MIVAFDNSLLTLVFDPGGNTDISDTRKKISTLMDDLASDKSQIIIPSTALAEALTRQGSRYNYVPVLKKYGSFRIVPFTEICAVELAEHLKTYKAKRRKDIYAGQSFQKVKFDRQIVVTAYLYKAKVLYTADEDMAKFAEELGMSARRLDELPIKPKQGDLFHGSTGQDISPPTVVRRGSDGPASSEKGDGSEGGQSEVQIESETAQSDEGSEEQAQERVAPKPSESSPSAPPPASP